MLGAIPPLLDVKSAATFLNVDEKWIYKNYERLAIPFRHVGGHLRIKMSDLETWFDKQK